MNDMEKMQAEIEEIIRKDEREKIFAKQIYVLSVDDFNNEGHEILGRDLMEQEIKEAKNAFEIFDWDVTIKNFVRENFLKEDVKVKCPKCQAEIGWLVHVVTGTSTTEVMADGKGFLDYNDREFEDDGQRSSYECPECRETITGNIAEAANFLAGKGLLAKGEKHE